MLSHIITKELITKPPWTRKYQITIELSSLSKQQTQVLFKKYTWKNYKDYLEVYTDGSKTQGVGVSIIFPSKKMLYKLPLNYVGTILKTRVHYLRRTLEIPRS